MPNRSIPFINVPHAIFPAKTPTDAIRALVATALAEKLSLTENNAQGIERKTIFVPPVLDLKIELLAKEKGWTYQVATASLVTSAMAFIAQKRTSVEASKADVSVPFLARPGQDVFYKSIMASIATNRICLAEASTGIGKSRALVAAAIQSVILDRRPVVIAAPTLAILGGSLWMEYEQLVADGLGATVKARFYPGISEFVDHVRLSDYLQKSVDLFSDEEPVDQDVLDWVKMGGPNMTQTPLSKAMSGAGLPLCWLMSDLRDIATGLDPAEFAVESGKEGSEIRTLIDQIRLDARGADIVFCTHAMLARAQQGSWEWFPKPAVLILDEAHLFEGIVSGIYSNRMSIYAVRHSARVMRKATSQGPSSAVGRLSSTLTNLINVLKNADDGQSGGIDMRSGSRTVVAISESLEKLTLILKSGKLSKLPKIAEVRIVVADLQKAIRGDTNAYGRIEFSPDRRFPAVLVGRRSIASKLGALWKDIEGGVVLASATLSTPDEFGNSKFDYMASLLALPASRLDSPNPVIAAWTRSIPVVHTPKQPEQYCRSSFANRCEETEKAWFAVVAAQIIEVARSAKGGTMVLLTSYAQVKGIQEEIAALDGLDKSGNSIKSGRAAVKRLIAQNPDERFAGCEARFRAAHSQGKRPVLLAVGVAWTGVDFTDKSAASGKDFLLTDLVIGCLPIGLNRSSTMAARLETQGLYPLVREALMTLLQGLGRAVRSETATNKNIWILDGRIWKVWQGMKPFQQSARRLLDKYPNQQKF